MQAAGVAALNVVLRTTTHSYGNMRFSGIPSQPKPLNRSRLNFVRLIMSVSLRDVPKMIVIGWLGVAPQIGEIKPQLSYYTLPYLNLPYLFFILVCLYSPNG